MVIVIIQCSILWSPPYLPRHLLWLSMVFVFSLVFRHLRDVHEMQVPGTRNEIISLHLPWFHILPLASAIGNCWPPDMTLGALSVWSTAGQAMGQNKPFFGAIFATLWSCAYPTCICLHHNSSLMFLFCSGGIYLVLSLPSSPFSITILCLYYWPHFSWDTITCPSPSVFLL